MVAARRAAVRPRVTRPGSSECPLLLEQVIEQLLEEHRTGLHWLLGPPGSGKTTALAHLADAFSSTRLLLLDELDDPPIRDAPTGVVMLRAHRSRSGGEGFVPPGDREAGQVFVMAPWERDDLIEYLLATYPDRCADVLARTEKDEGFLDGSPRLWSLVLDRLVADSSLRSARSVIAERVDELLAGAGSSAAKDYCLKATTIRGTPDLAELLTKERGVREETICWYRHAPIRNLVAARALVEELARDRTAHLVLRLPEDLVREAASLVARDPRPMHALMRALSTKGGGEGHAMAATLLHAAVPNRLERFLRESMKEPGQFPSLSRARLPESQWSSFRITGVDLGGIVLDHSDLTRAVLRETDLRGAKLQEAVLCEARILDSTLVSTNLTRADLRECRIQDSDFQGASLRRAKLPGAVVLRSTFHGTDLQWADLEGGTLTGVDFRECVIRGASFEGARLEAVSFTGIRFEAVRLNDADLPGDRFKDCRFGSFECSGADFFHSTFHGCDLTGAEMPRCSLRACRFQDCGLAHVDWEGADLREARFEGVTFHLGSSRSGLVFSSTASEGTRTGFYTDDFDDQTFKSPEEIRKANLRGADLREAVVFDTDFYLVDLRDGRYDRAQEAHFRKCGAILSRSARG